MINNKGVTKWTDTREILDEQASAKVVIDCGKIGKIEKATELRSGRDMACDQGEQKLELDVGPGDIRIILIKTQDG